MHPHTAGVGDPQQATRCSHELGRLTYSGQSLCASTAEHTLLVKFRVPCSNMGLLGEDASLPRMMYVLPQATTFPCHFPVSPSNATVPNVGHEQSNGDDSEGTHLESRLDPAGRRCLR